MITARKLLTGFALAAGLAVVGGCATPPDRPSAGFDPAVVEQHILELTNRERALEGRGRLVRITALDGAARAHSRDMGGRDYFAHASPEGERPMDRFRRTGYDCFNDEGVLRVAENLAQHHTYDSRTTRGQRTAYHWYANEEALARQIVGDWMQSPDHGVHILERDFTRTGVGVAITPDEKVYATQLFC